MLLTALLLAAASTQPPAAPTGAEAEYQACVERASRDPAGAIAEAEAWRDRGGGMAARQCLGLAFVGTGQWLPAAAAFEQAARDAEIKKDPIAADLWVQAGNASLAGDDAAKARNAFDRALSLDSLTGPLRGEAIMDRARAAVAMNEFVAARTDLDEALRLVPADPMGWLLSATLARRMGDLSRADRDIAEARRLAPDDAAVAYEEGSIAYARGDMAAARAAWQGIVDRQPQSAPADFARQGLQAIESGAASAN